MKDQRGFTVVELAITLLVIAAISSLAIPNLIRTMRVISLDSAASQIQKDLNLAKIYATSRSQNGVVDFNLSLAPNVLDPKTGNPTRTTPSEVPEYQIGVGTSQPTMVLHRTLNHYVSFLEDPFAGGADYRYIYFDPDGVPHFVDTNGNGQFTVGISAGDMERHIVVMQDRSIRIFEREVGGIWNNSNW